MQGILILSIAACLLLVAYAVTSGGVTVKPSFSQTISGATAADYAVPAEIANLGRQYSNGTGALQFDLLYNKKITLSAAAQTLDLTAVTDAAGGAINFARVREFILYNPSSFPVTIGAAAATQWIGMLGTVTSTLTIPAGGSHMFADPTSVGGGVGAVVTGSSKSLKLDPGANTLVLTLIMAGCSAAS
jgi:hypothetical protein